MGGSSYDRDVGSSSSSDGFYSGGTSSAVAKNALGASGADPSTSPLDRTIRSDRESPIVVALDVTGSNIEFARIVYDKAPMLHGQIEQQGYLKDFDICFAAVGDAHGDRAPLQVCDFQFGIALDEQLKKLFLEGNGGGQRMETYELAAHFFNQYCDMPKAKLPFLFMIGDEAPYPYLEASTTREVLGRSTGETLETKAIFAETFKKFGGNAFFLQNPYCGNRSDTYNTGEIRQEWVSYVGPANAEKIIPIHEEKSVVDVILGTIAMVSRVRDMRTYIDDMHSRGQTQKRIENVQKSLKGLETALVPYAGVNLPAKSGGKKKGSGGRRL